jgi:tetratricopeptide (TPR) repeat protein
MKRIRLLRPLVAVIVIAGQAFVCDAARRAPARGNDGSAQLGAVNFRTSCTPQVQGSMDKAIALLHSFQYQQAEAAFSAVAQRDSGCAMAYWGKAMSLYHQLWDFPDAETLAKGRAYAAQAQTLGGKTQTERDYIAAAAAFYDERANLSHAARVAGYARAMEAVYKDSAQDPNAAGFYALALVNLADYEDELANREKAIAVLQPMFAKYPDNPGLAHYLIHATDTPALAPQGLAAAQRYAKIAPDSSHALHMPSHIFTRLGLWQDSIDSNLAAAAAAARATRAHEADATYQLHAMDFLDYAYLQSGQEAKARQLIVELKSVPGASAENIADHEGYFAARNALELHRWKEAAALVPPNLPMSRLDDTYYARAMGAARSGDPKAARAELAKLDEAISAARGEAKKMGYTAGSGDSIERQEVTAWIEFAGGKREQALKTLRAAADREDAEGVDSLAMPAREMLGDMLLQEKQPKEALEAYRAALKESPNRFDGLWGAARAAEAAGDAPAARQYYAKLVAICGPGTDRPELQQARAYPAAK